MPQKHQVTKKHEIMQIINLILVKFSVFVLWWLNMEIHFELLLVSFL
jgi:hypothetical protein